MNSRGTLKTDMSLSPGGKRGLGCAHILHACRQIDSQAAMAGVLALQAAKEPKKSFLNFSH